MVGRRQEERELTNDTRNCCGGRRMKRDLNETLSYWGNYIYEYRDPVTGVNYLICKMGDGVAIIPRYDADGTLMVTEK